MSIGYASVAIGLPGVKMKTTTQKYATPEYLTQLIAHNLNMLSQIFDYNMANGIHMFRISSDIIPFGSSPVNTLVWQQLFAKELSALGAKAKRYNIRLSMHPGQYTVLNSPNADVVERAVIDLEYHTSFLDAMQLGPENKIILHIGGVYGDKKQAAQRFINAYQKLAKPVKARLIIENDDKMYTVNDVLAISGQTGIPVVYDNLHHALNHGGSTWNDYECIEACRKTWNKSDGTQKMHYSQQDASKKPGSHSASISINPFLQFYRGLNGLPIDIMLEVKDKNLSAVKCTLCTDEHPHIKNLEAEWSRYKYTVLEKAPTLYHEIRELLKNKNRYPAMPFYQRIETSLAQPFVMGSFVNAAQHIWGYFKNSCTAKEKASFQQTLQRVQQGEAPPAVLKRQLQRLATKYQQLYLLQSYYFML